MNPLECMNCSSNRLVRCFGGFEFRGYHDPYKGKWIIEIKECPKKMVNNSNKKKKGIKYEHSIRKM